VKQLFLSILALVFGAVALILSITVGWRGEVAKEPGVSPSTPSTPSTPGNHAPWLHGKPQEKFLQVERHFRGTDIAMIEVGYRFTELYFAGQDGNWTYAEYQVKKIEKVIRLAMERRPKRSESASLFLKEDLPEVRVAVEAKDREKFQSAMKALRAACMKCHVREKVPYFTVELPSQRLSPIRPSKGE